MQQLTNLFKALSDTNRIRVLKMLEVRPLCVCEIKEVLDLATSTVSKHLSILREADLIQDEKEGKWVNISLKYELENEYLRHLIPLMRSWLADDTIIKQDKEKVSVVNRNTLCST